MNKTKIRLLASTILLTLFLVQVKYSNQADAMYFGEDRYKPQTCTKVDEEGEYEKAICEKVVVDGPCVDEVTCDDKPSIGTEW